MTTRFTPSENFRPLRGLGSRHAQTIFASLCRPAHRPPMQRERWELPDGDFLDLDILKVSASRGNLVVLHGLEGSSQSSYVANIIRLATAAKLSVYALNFRSCGGEINRLPRSYHSGDTGDLLWVAQKIAQSDASPLYAIGFSLGGNVVLRTLATANQTQLISRAVAISPPFFLERSVREIDKSRNGWAWIYRERFLRALRAKALTKASLFPDKFDSTRITRVRSLEQYDDCVTGPIHGFSGAAEYYAKSSSGFVLDQIRTPTLLIHSLDDPFAPFDVPQAAKDNPHLSLLMTERGGHVGFVSGTWRRPRYWAEEQAVNFLIK